MTSGEIKPLDIIIFSDSYDVILQSEPSNIVSQFHTMAKSHQLIVSAEHGGTVGSPIPNFLAFYNLPDICGEDLVFVNAGFKVATAQTMQSHFQDILTLSPILRITDDQILTCHLLNKHPENYILDTRSRICLNAHPETHHNLQFESAAVVSTNESLTQEIPYISYNGNRPLALHFPGMGRKVQVAKYKQAVDNMNTPRPLALEAYRTRNESHHDCMVLHLSYRGFFAELDDIPRAMIYAWKHNLQFLLDSSRFPYRVKHGWNDYFKPFCLTPNDVDSSRICKRFEFHPQGKDRIDKRPIQVFTPQQLEINGIQLTCFQNIHAYFMRMIYRLNDSCQADISRLIDKLALPPDYYALHIRRGDKIGDEDVRYPASLYIDRAGEINNDSCVFAMSDDYQAIEEVRTCLFQRGIQAKVATLGEPKDRGFDVNKLRRGERFMGDGKPSKEAVNRLEKSYKYRQTVRLLADMSIALGATSTVSTYGSFVGRVLSLLQPSPRTVKLLQQEDFWSTTSHYDSVNTNKSHILDRYKKVLVIHIGHYGAGFFAYVQYAINQILYCERNNYLPVVHYDEKYNNYFHDPAFGNNMWEYYFEPVAHYSKSDIEAMIADPDDRLERSDILTLSELEILQLCQFNPESVFHYTYGYWREHLPENPDEWFDAMRKKGHRVVSDYLHIKESIVRNVQQYYRQNMRPNYVIGVHIRGTDMRYAPSVSLQVFCNEINRRLKHLPENSRIFVATDQKQYIEVLKEYYGEKLLYQQCVRSSDSRNPMWFKERSPSEQGEEVLVDALILARCNFMLKCPSAVSEFAHYFNPLLRSLDLNYHKTDVAGQDYAMPGMGYGNYPTAWKLVGHEFDKGNNTASQPNYMNDFHWNLLQKYSVQPETIGNQKAETTEEKARLSRYSVPASGQVDDCWIITSADSKFWNMLISFIASLRDVAHNQSRVGVIDYGLTQPQCSALRNLGIEIIQPKRKYALIIDRYFTTAEYFADNSESTIYYFDADIWFTEPFDELFENKNIHNGYLAAAKDVWECDYYYTCTPKKYHLMIKQMLEEVIRDYGQSLQAGFIAGSSGAWLRLTDLMKMILAKGFATNSWGTDALALNFYSKLFEDRFTLLPITYNAPPAWDLENKNNRFYARNFKHDTLYKPEDGPVLIKAIHRTSPYREPNRMEHLVFENVHPGIFKKWCDVTGNSAIKSDCNKSPQKKNNIKFHVLLWGIAPYSKKIQIYIQSQHCLRTSEKYSLTPEIIGIGYDDGDSPKTILSQKRFHLLEEKLKTISDDDIILVMDSFDTLFCGTESEIIAKFKSFNTEILFSAQQRFTYQLFEYKKNYDTVSSPYKYLAAGTYIGYAHALRIFIKKCIKMTQIDQFKNGFEATIMGAYLHEHYFKKEKYRFDINCDLFWVTIMDPQVEFKNNSLYNSSTDSHPLVLHFKDGNRHKKSDFINCFSHIMEKLH